MAGIEFEDRLQVAISSALVLDECITVYEFPVLRQTPARWWQWKELRYEWRLDEALEAFGLPRITQEMRDAYWREVRKGQSVYEDAGGYLWRCWRAAFGLPVEEPYTYKQAIADLTEAAE